jgi:hypothetical protein
MRYVQIDTSTTAGKAEVMRLAAEGREVVSRPKRVNSGWYKAPYAEWDWTNYNYAIISEPVGPEEVWVGVADNGSVVGVGTAHVAISPNRKAVRYIRADLAGEGKA